MVGSLVLWLFLCLIVSLAGTNKPIGYWKVFFISLVLSPLIGLIIALCSSDFKSPNPIYKCNHCGYRTEMFSYYCPRCGKDNDGYTIEENQQRFN